MTTTAQPTLGPRELADLGNHEIDQELVARVNKIIEEMNDLIKERDAVVHGVWVGRIGQLHVLMLGPGGTGKSFLARTKAAHITGSKYFEVAFDETTDPSQVMGPPNVKRMMDDGRTEFCTEGMLPWATDVLLDEFFNGNTPLLHATMPLLNERIQHNGAEVVRIPLRQALMGTNKLNADTDLHALFDRVHLRYTVEPLKDRENVKDMLAMAVARIATIGRGPETRIDDSFTTVSLEELDAARVQAMHIPIDDPVIDMFLDIREELQNEKGIEVSDRRANDGMVAVLSNAWLRGHTEVQPGDLDILSTMFWTVQDQQKACRDVVLAATAPGEKVALDLLDTLDKLKAEMRKVEGEDEETVRRVAIEQVRNAEKIKVAATEAREQALAAGTSTQRLDECLSRTETFKIEAGNKVFGLSASEMSAMSNV